MRQTLFTSFPWRPRVLPTVKQSEEYVGQIDAEIERLQQVHEQVQPMIPRSTHLQKEHALWRGKYARSGHTSEVAAPFLASSHRRSSAWSHSHPGQSFRCRPNTSSFGIDVMAPSAYVSGCKRSRTRGANLLSTSDCRICIFVTHALYRIDGKNELSPLATLLSTIQAANDQINSMDFNFRFAGCFDTSTQAQGRHSRFSNLEVRE